MTREAYFIDGILSRQVCRALEAPDLAQRLCVARVLVSELVVSASFSSLSARHQTRLLRAVLIAQMRGVSFASLDSGLHVHGWGRMRVVLDRLSSLGSNYGDSATSWDSNVEMLGILSRFVLRCRGPSHSELAAELLQTAASVFPKERCLIHRDVLDRFVGIMASVYASISPSSALAFSALHRTIESLHGHLHQGWEALRGLDGDEDDILVCADGEADILLLVDRSDIVTSSSLAILGCTDDQWERCQTIDIRFTGETSGGEGVARDWIGELCTELFFRSGLFSGCHDDPGVVHPSAALPDSILSRESMDLVGRVMALALRLEIPTGAHLSNAAVAMITGQDPDIKRDIFQLDPVLARSCAALLQGPQDEEIDLGRFVMMGTDQELFPGGALVSVGRIERRVFSHMLCRGQVFGRFPEACLWIRRGMRHVLSEEMCVDIDSMGPRDFNASFGGQGIGSKVDVADWRRHTEISDEDQALADVLFRIIVGMEATDRRRLLRFWTGSSSLPYGGFHGLSGHLRLVVQDNHMRLPTSHTCIRTLILPRYRSAADMMSAIRLCLVSMDFDDSTE